LSFYGIIQEIKRVTFSDVRPIIIITINVLIKVTLNEIRCRGTLQSRWSVVDRGVGDWGSCPGHQGRGHQRGRTKI